MLLRQALTVFFAAVACTSAAIGIEPFAAADSSIPRSTDEHRNLVRFGSYDGHRTAQAVVGFDFPFVAAMQSETPRRVAIGLTASVRIYMFPEGSVFHVDNFYATFATYLEARFTKELSLRAYPFYHLSAHLSDGYRTGTVEKLPASIDEAKHTISNEKVYAVVRWHPRDWIDASLGTGTWFHSIGRDLRYTADASITLRAPLKTLVIPEGYLMTEVLNEGSIRTGLEGGIGIRITPKVSMHRSFGIMVRGSQRPHAGRYYATTPREATADFTFTF